MRKNNRFNNSIDCILDIQGRYTVLIRRGKDPYKGMWALPGGRQLEGEDLDDTCLREVPEETGIVLTPRSDDIPLSIDVAGESTVLEQIRTYCSGADPRGGNTTLYAVQLRSSPEYISSLLRHGDDATDARVWPLNAMPELAFDHQRLVEDYFLRLKRYKNPIPTTDIIIEYTGQQRSTVLQGIVLITRKNPPYGLALPGGYAEHGISLEDNAIKEAKEETGLDIRLLNPETPLCVHSNPRRDPRTHTLSATYIAEGHGPLKAGDDAKTAQVFTLEEIRKFIAEDRLAFDHARILEKYLDHKSRWWDGMSEHRISDGLSDAF